MSFLGLRLTRTYATSRATVVAPALKSFPATAADWLRGRDLDAGAVGAAMTNAYEQVVWVYRAINVLAEQIANIPFLFSSGERGRETLITHGPLLDFYARPHPHINRFQYWELRIIWLMLRGECFRIPIYEEPSPPVPSTINSPAINPLKRRLRRVLMLDPARFQHIVRGHELIGWRYTGFGPETPLASQIFLPEEVWFEKLPNPFDFWRGLPPLYAASMAARTEFAAGAFMRGIIENNADTGLIVRTEKPLDPDQQQQLLATLRERKRRAGMADRPTLITGAAEIIKPELSSSDLQFLENRKFSRGEICAAFGVPEEILTATDHAKYDVMQGARQNFIENRVAPLCGRLEAEEDALIKSLDPAAVGWFDLDSLPILQQARRTRLTAARAGFEMGVPFNELNRVLDLGFKPLPWGDRGYVAAGLQSAGESAAAAVASHARAEPPKTGLWLNPDPQPEPLSSPLQAMDQLLTALRPSLTFSVPGPEGKTDEPQRTQSSQGRQQRREFAKKLSRFLFEQRGRVLSRLREISKSDPTRLSKDVLDLTAEDALLETRLGAPGKAAPDLATLNLNQRIATALHSSLEPGIQAGESLEELSTRARAVYNQAIFRAIGEPSE